MGKGAGGCDDRSSIALGTDEALIEDALQRIAQWPLKEIYTVGGRIRDRYLKKNSKDLDLAVCGHTYGEVSAVAKKYGSVTPLEVAGSLVGLRFYASWTPPEGIEIALARREESTGPGYHDFQIVPHPSVSITEDLLRRDYTVNAIAENIRTGEEIDPFGGIQDCRDRVLRTVSDESYRDDPLRILRGLSRVAKDGFHPTPAVIEGMKEYAEQLHPARQPAPVSGERIREQFVQILNGDHARKSLELARDTGVLAAALPEFAECIGFDQESKYHSMTVDEHIFSVVDAAAAADAPEEVRIAALFHDIGKPASAWRGKDGRLHYYYNKKIPNCPSGHERIGTKTFVDVWERWGGDNDTRDAVAGMIAEHMYTLDNDCAARIERGQSDKLERNARRWLQRIGTDPENLMLLRRCDRLGKAEQPPAGWDTDLIAWEGIVRSQYGQPITRKALAIDGNDLLGIGAAGIEIGEIQAELLKRVVNNPNDNTSQQLLQWSHSLLQSVRDRAKQ